MKKKDHSHFTDEKTKDYCMIISKGLQASLRVSSSSGFPHPPFFIPTYIYST